MCKRIFQLLFVLVISVVTISPAMAAQATNIVIEVVASKSMRFSWTPGSGDGSIVTMRLQATPESAPVDGIDYAADSDYSLAPQTAGSSGNFVVYKGSEKMVTVSGLVQNTTYTIAVYDYTGSGAGTNYLQLEPATINQATNDLAMHNYDNGIADCSTCHSNHGGDGLVPRGTGQEDVCKTCHNPLGAASNMSDIAMHGTPNHAAADVDCGSCHELHRINPGGGNTTESTHPVTAVIDYNLAFIRSNVDKYISTATTDDAVNQTKGEDQAIEGGTAVTSRGICQACHTGTDYHRNNSAVELSQCHRGGTSDTCNGSQVICTDCHTHSGGFEPAGGCIACHSSTQGGTPPADRRAIAAEFNNASTHIEFLSLLDDDCVVCHQQSSITPSHSHQDGLLTLWNVDNHSSTGYQLLDHTDPLTSSTEAAKLNTFCLNCHDSNGAQAELDPAVPFSGSIAPVDIATNWSASTHAGRSLTCMGDGAFGCHGGGHGGEKLNLLAPASPAATPPNFTEEEEGFCYTCHSPGQPGKNIQAEFARGTNTSTRTYHHPVVNSEQGVSRTVECNDCHDPHAATGVNAVKGTSGIDLNGNPVTSATAEYQVCLKCHGDTYPVSRDINSDGHSDSSNKRLDFAANASAYHPVQQAGRNTSTAMAQQLLPAGYTTASTILCSECHASDTTAIKGPHGSTTYPILRAAYDLAISGPESPPASNFELCYLCHDQTMHYDTALWSNGARTNFYGGNGDNLHYDHFNNWGTGATCRTCHYNTHGNQSANNTIYRINDGGTTDYPSPPTGYKTRGVDFSPYVTGFGSAKPVFYIDVSTRTRYCDLSCHGTTHDGFGDFEYNPQASHGVSAADDDPLTIP